MVMRSRWPLDASKLISAAPPPAATETVVSARIASEDGCGFDSQEARDHAANNRGGSKRDRLGRFDAYCEIVQAMVAPATWRV